MRFLNVLSLFTFVILVATEDAPLLPAELIKKLLDGRNIKKDKQVVVFHHTGYGENLGSGIRTRAGYYNDFRELDELEAPKDSFTVKILGEFVRQYRRGNLAMIEEASKYGAPGTLERFTSFCQSFQVSSLV